MVDVNLNVTGIANVAANAAGVCPQAVDSSKTTKTFNPKLGNHASYQAEMLTSQTNFLSGTTINGQNGGAMRVLYPKIVSIGADNTSIPAGTGTVYSRQLAILAPIAPLQAVEGENSVKINGLSLCIAILGCTNLTGTLNGDVLSRGDLTTPSVFAGLNLTNGLVATLAYGGTLSGGLTIANAQHVSPASNIILRPTVSVATTKPNCSVAANCTALGSAYSSATNTFTLASGTVTFQSGDYVFCNFNATGGTVNVNPTSSAPVRIFVDSPTSTRCKSNGLGSNQGNFNDTAGFNNQLLGTGGVLAASGMQVYVVGDGSYDNNTTVQIGPSSNTGLLSLTAATYGAIVYAPTSKVTVNVPAACVSLLISTCTGGVFQGAIVGNDTTVEALTITQDLNIGNYPLYAGVNAFRPVQYVQCDTSVTSLSQSTADLNGC